MNKTKIAKELKVTGASSFTGERRAEAFKERIMNKRLRVDIARELLRVAKALTAKLNLDELTVLRGLYAIKNGRQGNLKNFWHAGGRTKPTNKDIAISLQEMGLVNGDFSVNSRGERILDKEGYFHGGAGKTEQAPNYVKAWKNLKRDLLDANPIMGYDEDDDWEQARIDNVLYLIKIKDLDALAETLDTVMGASRRKYGIRDVDDFAQYLIEHY